MIIELKEITIRDVVKSYINNDESGCVAYDGKLNIRPAYQREFVYKEKQRNAVRETGKRVGKENGIKSASKRRKLILNELTGIYYIGLQDAADSIGIRKGTLNAMMVGQNKNKTGLKYV